MNNTVIELSTKVRRAMRPYVLFLYNMVLEGKMESVLEIGVGVGQSSQAILSAMKEKGSGKLISIDHKNRQNKVPEDLKPYWELIVGDSTDENIVRQIYGKMFDLILIDGGHYNPVPMKDFNNFSVCIKNGGYILMHDIVNTDCDVPEVWNQIKNSPSWNTIDLPFNHAGMGIAQRVDHNT